MPEKKPGTQLEKCPNYSTCQTMVQAVKRGLPHKYGEYDQNQGKIVYKDCSGG